MYLRKSLKRIIKGFHFSEESGPILIYGETGVGKEVLANEIHKKLQRSGKFVPVHLSAIPEHLFESELFGHKKGAFTDAREDKKGLIEEANKGTLFLDEIADIPYEFQIKLLRAVETKRFRRLGETEERNSDFFLICATKRDLRELVKNKKFREDLYYRFKGKIINLPSLREEPEEILPLLNGFLKKLGKECLFSEKVIEYLLCYSWPGNVRELKRFSEILPFKEFIELKDLDFSFFEEHFCSYEKVKKEKTIIERINCRTKRFLKIEIEDFLRKGGDIKGLRRELGYSRSKVYEILKELGIKADFKKGRPKNVHKSG